MANFILKQLYKFFQYLSPKIEKTEIRISPHATILNKIAGRNPLFMRFVNNTVKLVTHLHYTIDITPLFCHLPAAGSRISRISRYYFLSEIFWVTFFVEFFLFEICVFEIVNYLKKFFLKFLISRFGR